MEAMSSSMQIICCRRFIASSILLTRNKYLALFNLKLIKLVSNFFASFK